MPDDGCRYELIEGELIRMSPAGAEHGAVIMNIVGPLFQHVGINNLGRVYAAETGFKLRSDPDTVRAPAVAFVSRERVDHAGMVRGYWIGAPDLAVEVLSPEDSRRQADAKARHWLAAGAKLVWVVDPKTRRVTVYSAPVEIINLSEGDRLNGEDVVRDFQLPVADIFRTLNS